MIDVNKIYTSNNCGDFKITKYAGWDKVYIEFLLTGYKMTTQSCCVKDGRVKDKLYPSVYGVGFIGAGVYKTSIDGKSLKVGSLWRSMIRRCYSAESLKINPTYINCSVCEEWHNFQNFAKWFDINYVEGLHIDKDIKQSGVESKIYSPETCRFVSLAENNIEAHAINHTMIDPNNKEREIYNMANFCIGKDLNSICMAAVSRGELKHHKGWTKA